MQKIKNPVFKRRVFTTTRHEGMCSTVSKQETVKLKEYPRQLKKDKKFIHFCKSYTENLFHFGFNQGDYGVFGFAQYQSQHQGIDKNANGHI